MEALRAVFVSLQKFQCLRNRLTRPVAFKMNLTDQSGKKAANLAVVLTQVLVVVTVVLAAQRTVSGNILFQLLPRNSRKDSGAQLRIGVRPIKDNQAGFEQAEGSIGRQSSVQAIRHFIQKAKIRIVRRVGYDVQGLRKRKEISPS